MAKRMSRQANTPKRTAAFMTRVQVPVEARNVFDLSHPLNDTFKFGNLNPVLVQECVPGDRFQITAEPFIRMMPMLAPVMGEMNVFIHCWFVPNRITWDGWKDFITQKDNTKVLPTITLAQTDSDDVKYFNDKMGLPPLTGVVRNVLAFPHAAYQMVYNEFYRNANLISEVDYKLVDGDNSGNAALTTMRRRSYEHDYFTSCLPNQQKGSTVTLPQGSVVLNTDWQSDGQWPSWDDDGGNIVDSGNVEGNPQSFPYSTSHVKIGSTPVAYNPQGSLLVSPVALNDLRVAITLQQYLELQNVAGIRYPEWIRGNFGVDIEDYRIDRPEYLGGLKSPCVISEVLNSTGPTEFFNQTEGRPEQTGSAQGTMAGHGVSLANNQIADYYCKEHGYIIAILSVMPRTQYSQGIDRHWLHNDYLDYYNPKFAHLSEQPVFNQEVYANSTNPNGTFGYQPIYSWMRYRNGRVAGDMRSSLDYWTLVRQFNTAPALNQDFVECDPSDPLRIFAVQDGTDPLVGLINWGIRAIRPLPVYGTPGVMHV